MLLSITLCIGSCPFPIPSPSTRIPLTKRRNVRTHLELVDSEKQPVSIGTVPGCDILRLELPDTPKKIKLEE